MSPSSSASKTAPTSSFPRLQSRIPPLPITCRTFKSGNYAPARLPFIAQLSVALNWSIPQYSSDGLDLHINISPVRRASVDKYPHATQFLAQSAPRLELSINSTRTCRKDEVMYCRLQNRFLFPRDFPLENVFAR